MTQELSPGPARYSITHDRCFRCATCTSLAPGVFTMEERAARVVRQPDSGEDRACEAARIACPGRAIGREGAAAGPGGGGVIEPALFPRLFDESERVRWKLTDVPWGAIEKDKPSSAFVRFVSEVALSELTTFTATRRFLNEMSDDVDFTSWAAIWFYEETKHPEALFRWLAAFGHTFDSRAVLRSRVTAPFMRSRTGTLVMNILSEMFASAGYQDLAAGSREPVLGLIARHLAGDEARHAAAFYLFSERAIALAKNPEYERLQAIKVLYYWVRVSDHVEHPIHQFHAKVASDPDLAVVLRDLGTDYGPVIARACRMIGTLTGHPLTGPDDVLPALRDLSARLGQPV